MGQRNQDVLIVDVADNQTILAGQPINFNASGQAQKQTDSFTGDVKGIALTDITFTTTAQTGNRPKLGILRLGRFTFTGLVENDDSGTYTTDITAGDPVGLYWSGSSIYAVNNTSNPIGTSQEALIGNTNTNIPIEGVGTIAATGLELNHVPITGAINIRVPDKVFTITENNSSAAVGVCDVNLTSKALVFNSNDVTSYTGQQVYATYNYDANSNTTGDIEVDVSILPKGSVVGDEIADGAISAADIADGSITAAKIAADAVTTGKLANDAVTTGKIADNAVGATDLDSTGNFTIGTLLTTGNASVTGTLDVTPTGGAPVITFNCNSSDAAGSISGYIPVTVNGVTKRIVLYDVN